MTELSDLRAKLDAYWRLGGDVEGLQDLLVGGYKKLPAGIFEALEFVRRCYGENLALKFAQALRDEIPCYFCGRFKTAGPLYIWWANITEPGHLAVRTRCAGCSNTWCGGQGGGTAI